MGRFIRAWGLAIAVFFLFLSTSWSRPSALDPCEEAMDAYQETYQAFQDLSLDCQGEAGIDPRATLDGCPSVDPNLFVSLVSEMEKRHHEVCFQCDGWPTQVLGEGSCAGR